MPDQVHQIGRVLAVVDGEGGIKSDPIGIFAQEPGPDTMERTCPSQRIGHGPGAVADDLPRDALNAPGHFGGGATRKGHQQYSTGIGTVDDQMSDPVSQRVGLSGTRAGDDEERRTRCGAFLAHTMLDSSSLFAVEAFIYPTDIGGKSVSGGVPVTQPRFLFCSQTAQPLKRGH